MRDLGESVNQTGTTQMHSMFRIPSMKNVETQGVESRKCKAPGSAKPVVETAAKYDRSK
jgi:hypothetical protein